MSERVCEQMLEQNKNSEQGKDKLRTTKRTAEQEEQIDIRQQKEKTKRKHKKQRQRHKGTRRQK